MRTTFATKAPQLPHYGQNLPQRSTLNSQPSVRSAPKSAAPGLTEGWEFKVQNLYCLQLRFSFENQPELAHNCLFFKCVGDWVILIRSKTAPTILLKISENVPVHVIYRSISVLRNIINGFSPHVHVQFPHRANMGRKIRRPIARKPYHYF